MIIKRGINALDLFLALQSFTLIVMAGVIAAFMADRHRLQAELTGAQNVNHAYLHIIEFYIHQECEAGPVLGVPQPVEINPEPPRRCGPVTL